MFIKLLTLFSISLGLVFFSDIIINREHFSLSGRCYVKRAIESVRLGKNRHYILWLNILLILLTIFYNL
jgi:hypothetical protein